jgi:nicotinamide mononucleotide transporter
MTFDTFLEILGLTVGLIYLWFEYHADARVWITSIIMPLISMWIYFSKGLYADFAINIYYVVIAIYGYAAWTMRLRRSKKSNVVAGEEEEKLPITHVSLPTWAGATLAFAILWALIHFVLIHFTNSTVPTADAFTTALSIVALWLMARKNAEQWLLWAVVDAVSVGLYIYKGIYFYATLYAIYTVLAFIGYRKWLRLMAEQQ